MATKTPSIPSFTVPGAITALPQGAEIAVFEKGIDLYERTKLNGEIELKLADGTTTKGVVRGMKVDTLIDLLPQFGHQSIYTYGRMYSAVNVIHALGEASGGEVVDVTKLHTAVIVSLPMQQMPV